MTPAPRQRIHVGALIPPGGPRRANVEVIAIWDNGTPLADVEEAIKEASRKAVRRARVVHGIESRPAPVDHLTHVHAALDGQITISYPE